jgi:hypothetical protein
MKYFTLTNSNGSLSKQFYAIADGYIEEFDKKQDLQVTLDGDLDVSMGSIFRLWNFTLRLRYDEDDGDRGTYADLIRFFKYNDPGGTPTNILTLVDFFGETFQVIFSQQVQPKPFATALEGLEAWYYVQVVFLCITAETEPTS